MYALPQDYYLVAPYFYFKNGMVYSLLDAREINLDPKAIRILRYCDKGKTLNQLHTHFDPALVHDLIKKKLLLSKDTLYQQTKIRLLEIETITYCNFRCAYCPVSLYPYPSHHVMDMTLFQTILHEAKKIPSIRDISLNFYCEPTLDPMILKRLTEIKRHGFRLLLHTNASHLNSDIRQALKQIEQTEPVRVNLPSLDASEYRRLTGCGNIEQALFNTTELLKSGIPVTVMVNGTRQEIRRNLPLIQQKFNVYDHCNILSEASNDRAGTLKNQYQSNLSCDVLTGCERILQAINIDVHGEILLCCNDYFKKYSIGNITKTSLKDLLKNDRAVEYRKKIFGALESPASFICKRCIHSIQMNRQYRYRMDKVVSYIDRM